MDLWADISAAEKRSILAAEMPYLAYAKKRIGLKEIPGAKHNPLILDFGLATDAGWKITTDEIAWCATFANAALVATGYPSTNSALARSFLSYGTKISYPVPGCIGVWPRGSPGLGHVGFVESVNKKAGTVQLISGNHGNAVTRATFQISSALGWRMPPGRGTKASYAPSLGERWLKRGMSGPDVEEAQVLLEELGYMINDPQYDMFGPDTEDAVRQFQRAHGLRVDGEIYTATAPALREAVIAKRKRKEKEKTGVNAGTVGAVGGVGAVATVTAVVRETTDAARGVGAAAMGVGGGVFLAGLIVVMIAIGGFVAYRVWLNRS